MRLTALLSVRPAAFLDQALLSAAAGSGGKLGFRVQELSRATADASTRAVPIVTIVPRRAGVRALMHCARLHPGDEFAPA